MVANLVVGNRLVSPGVLPELLPDVVTLHLISSPSPVPPSRGCRRRRTGVEVRPGSAPLNGADAHRSCLGCSPPWGSLPPPGLSVTKNGPCDRRRRRRCRSSPAPCLWARRAPAFFARPPPPC